MAHHLLDLFVGYERPVHAADASATGHIQHVALSKQLLGAHFTEDGAAVDFRGDLKRDAGRKVGLDGAGDDVDRRPLRGQNHMQAGGARHLRQALHRAFDILAGDHHQVGHFVDDDDDVGQRLEIELLVFIDRLAGFLVETGMHGARQFLALGLGFHKARIVAVDVAHAELGHFLVAFLHLAHRPLQRDHGLLRIGHDRRQQMRNAVIDGELEHLRIDHDQAALIGPQPINQAEDHGVDGDRFARAGGAGDQQMRHACEIDDDGFAADAVLDREQLAQINLLAMRVRQFDADGVAAGNDRDARR